LAETLDVSRNQVEKLVKDGLVSVNDKVITKTSYKIAVDDVITYTFKEAEKREAVEIDFDVEILYEDEYLMKMSIFWW